MRFCNKCQKWLKENMFRKYKRTARPNRPWRYDFMCVNCKAEHDRKINKRRSGVRCRVNEKPRDSQKNQIRAITKKAITQGLLVKRPCEACGNPTSELHHIKYDQPLDVQWLCDECHRKVHRKYHRLVI